MTAEERKVYSHNYYMENKAFFKRLNHIRYQAEKEARRRRAAENRQKNLALYADAQACIKWVRLNAGLKQKTVAEELGCSTQAVYCYETGLLPAPWEKLEAIIPGLKEAREMSITFETRREAYEQVRPAPMRKRITELLSENGGMTSSDIMAALGINNPNLVRPRLTELKDDGIIMAVAKRVPKCRETSNRFPEAVWELAV